MAIIEFDLQRKYERQLHGYRVEKMEKADWSEMGDQIKKLWKERMEWDPDDVILGETDDDIIANNLREILNKPGQYLFVAKDEHGKVQAMALFMDQTQMYPRSTETGKMAYLYAVCATDTKSGSGLTGPVLDTALSELQDMGYKSVEFHARVDEAGERGFATIAKKVFANSIIEEEGPKQFFSTEDIQMRYKVDIATHLMSI